MKIIVATLLSGITTAAARDFGVGSERLLRGDHSSADLSHSVSSTTKHTDVFTDTALDDEKNNGKVGDDSRKRRELSNYFDDDDDDASPFELRRSDNNNLLTGDNNIIIPENIVGGDDANHGAYEVSKLRELMM